jgi:hypothetical protein
MLGRWKMAVVAGMGLIGAVPVSAQTVVLTASLSRGAPASPPGVVVFPFAGDKGTSGWATITVDMSVRTLSYRLTVVNSSGRLTGQLHFAKTAGAGPAVLTFSPPVPMSIVLNNLADDICYGVDSTSFEGTIRAADLVLRPDEGIRSADDFFAAILAGKSYVTVVSSTDPDGEISGRVVPKP